MRKILINKLNWIMGFYTKNKIFTNVFVFSLMIMSLFFVYVFVPSLLKIIGVFLIMMGMTFSYFSNAYIRDVLRENKIHNIEGGYNLENDEVDDFLYIVNKEKNIVKEQRELSLNVKSVEKERKISKI